MFHLYAILLNGHRVGTIRALTKDQARRLAYFKLGSASRYSGYGMDSFTAIKVC